MSPRGRLDPRAPSPRRSCAQSTAATRDTLRLQAWNTAGSASVRYYAAAALMMSTAHCMRHRWSLACRSMHYMRHHWPFLAHDPWPLACARGRLPRMTMLGWCRICCRRRRVRPSCRHPEANIRLRFFQVHRQLERELRWRKWNASATIRPLL